MLVYNFTYLGNDGQVIWHGKSVDDQGEFNAYLSGPARSRLFDEGQRTQYEADLRALATTEMASDTITRLLASEPVKEPWEVGEALAECLLEEERGIKFPWNTERDKRTPKASLPGADVVGLMEDGEEALLVLGEVKTSSDANNPPQVMAGKSGMIHQLDNLATDISVHNCLLKWLHPRCKDTDFWPLYEKAAKRYLASGGRAIKLVGMLMRDTAPNELDLKNRAKDLATKVSAPTEVELDAWYFPTPIEDWPVVVQGGAV
ncbi:MAG: hypothetical protein PHI97_22365 [Desulfobulbus sp.]|nr:hypothetical protein [Desulfobulbus sp.]